MSLFNYLIASLIASAPFADEQKNENDGWFPVEHPVAEPVDNGESDPSIWVLFSKEFDDEKTILRFPADPDYRYSDGGFEATVSKDGETFQLKVLEKRALNDRIEEILEQPGAALLSMDQKGDYEVALLYLFEGKWVQERLLETSSRLYCLQTTGPEPDSKTHLQFAQSLRIEK